MVQSYEHFRQIETPEGNPQPGGVLLYFKNDGLLYAKDSTGTERQIDLAAALAAHIAATAAHGATGAVVGTTNTQTLTNKTLTAPKISQIKDTSGNVVLNLSPAGVANYVEVENSNSLVPPKIRSAGFDGNISLNLESKGTGIIRANGVQVADVSSSQSLTNKNLNSATNTFPWQFSFNTFSGTTDVNGMLQIPHGLGVTPTGISVITRGNTLLVPVVGTPDSTNIPVTIRNVSTGAVHASSSVSVIFIAIV